MTSPRVDAPASRHFFSPYVLLTFVSLFWAGNAVVGRYAVDQLGMPPFSLAFWRWAIALVILLFVGGPKAWAQRDKFRAHWRFLALLALLSVASFNLVQYTALGLTTAINAGVMGASLPALLFLLTWLAGQERATARQYTGLAAATVGVLIVVSRGQPAVLLALDLNSGDLLMMVALFIWAVYSVLLRRQPDGLDPLALLTVMVMFGIVGIAPFYAWDLWHVGGLPLTAETFLVLGYMGLFPSVLAYICWNAAVVRVGANASGMFTNMVPILIAILAVLFLGENFRLYHLAGMVCIFFGIYLATAWRLRSPWRADKTGSG